MNLLNCQTVLTALSIFSSLHWFLLLSSVLNLGTSPTTVEPKFQPGCGYRLHPGSFLHQNCEVAVDWLSTGMGCWGCLASSQKSYWWLQLSSPAKERREQKLFPLLNSLLHLFPKSNHSLIEKVNVTSPPTPRARRAAKGKVPLLPRRFCGRSIETRTSAVICVHVWMSSQKEWPLFWESPTQACFSLMYGEPMCAFMQFVLKALWVW